MTHNRLVDGFTAEDQQHRIVIGFEPHLLTVTLEQRQLSFAHHLLAIDLNRTVQHHQGGVATLMHVERSRLARVQTDVPHVDVSKRACRAAMTVKFTGNQA